MVFGLPDTRWIARYSLQIARGRLCCICCISRRLACGSLHHHDDVVSVPNLLPHGVCIYSGLEFLVYYHNAYKRSGIT